MYDCANYGCVKSSGDITIMLQYRLLQRTSVGNTATWLRLKVGKRNHFTPNPGKMVNPQASTDVEFYQLNLASPFGNT